MIPADAELTAAARRDPGVGRRARRPQAGAGPPDGDLRRVPGAHRPPRRSAHRRARRARRPRRHADLSTSSATTARAPRAPRTARSTRSSRSTAPPQFETTEFMAARIDEFGEPGGVQPLRGRLGARDGHAVPVDQAGRLALRRHPQRHDRALAERLRGTRRDAQPVPPRHRRRRDGPRRGRPPRADVRQRHPADAAARREHALRVRRRRAPPSAARPSTSRWSATAASTTRAGRRSPGTASRGTSGRAPRPRRRRLGALRHQHRLVPGARHRRGAPRQARTSCSACG